MGERDVETQKHKSMEGGGRGGADWPRVDTRLPLAAREEAPRNTFAGSQVGAITTLCARTGAEYFQPAHTRVSLARCASHGRAMNESIDNLAAIVPSHSVGGWMVVPF